MGWASAHPMMPRDGASIAGLRHPGCRRRRLHHGDDLLHVLTEGGEILAGQLATAGCLDFQRIERLAVEADLEMGMRASRAAGRADEADDLALAHRDPRLDGGRDAAHMGVDGLVI